MGYVKEFMDAKNQCSGQPMDMANSMALRDYINDLRSQPRTQIITMPMPFFMGQDMDMMRNMMGQSRMKRNLDLSPSNVQRVQMKMSAMIGNITCIFQTTGWMKEDKTPNYEKGTEEIKALKIDAALKADLLEIHSDCMAMAQCMPLADAKNPIKKELGEFMMWFKCSKMREDMACMKNDFRKYADKQKQQLPEDDMLAFAIATDGAAMMDDPTDFVL